jgi:hypothetical protein
MVAIVKGASEDYLTQDIGDPANDNVWLLLRTTLRRTRREGFLITDDGAHFHECIQVGYKAPGLDGGHGPYLELPDYYNVPVHVILQNKVEDPPERWQRALIRLCSHWAERRTDPNDWKVE